ncbi:MAG: DUF805 domain-containing protein [Phyllobacteriaceae bacterium]|nr:DUF805 domain-containing protein [Phyllobacteriaceae bacterium]
MPSLGSLLSLSGRSGRVGYWLTGVVQIVGCLLLLVMTGMFDPSADPRPDLASAGALIFGGLALAWLGFASTVRRWHDRDKSAWWCFVGGIPLLGPLWMLVELGFLPGTAGANRFGGPPGAGGARDRETAITPERGGESGGDRDAVVARWAASPASRPTSAAPGTAARFAAQTAPRTRAAPPGRGGTFGRRGVV